MAIRKNAILCGAILTLIPGLILGLTLGYSSEDDAQAFNNGQHLDTWWVDVPSFLFIDNIVYHTKENGQYLGHHILRPGNPRLWNYDRWIGQNLEVAAYPAVAVAPYHIGATISVVAVAYLSGEISDYYPPEYPYPIPRGELLRIKVAVIWGYPYIWPPTVAEYWFTVPDNVGNVYMTKGSPAIVFAHYCPPSGGEGEKYYFVLSYVGYVDDPPEYTRKLNLDLIKVTFPSGGGIPTIEKQNIRREGGGLDLSNPSTAVFEGSPTQSIRGFRLPEYTIYLHTVWQDPGYIGYMVTRSGSWDGPWNCVDPLDNIGVFDDYRNYNQHISAYGDRVFVSWTFSATDGQIVRRHKDVEYFDYPLLGWEPALEEDPEQISVWEGHPSTYHSDYPQGSGTSVVWTEQVSDDPTRTDIYLRDKDPDIPGEDLFFVVYDEPDPGHSRLADSFPHHYSFLIYCPPPLTPWYEISWTQENEGLPLPYRIAWYSG